MTPQYHHGRLLNTAVSDPAQPRDSVRNGETLLAGPLAMKFRRDLEPRGWPDVRLGTALSRRKSHHSHVTAAQLGTHAPSHESGLAGNHAGIRRVISTADLRDFDTRMMPKQMIRGTARARVTHSDTERAAYLPLHWLPRYLMGPAQPPGLPSIWPSETSTTEQSKDVSLFLALAARDSHPPGKFARQPQPTAPPDHPSPRRYRCMDLMIYGAGMALFAEPPPCAGREARAKTLLVSMPLSLRWP